MKEEMLNITKGMDCFSMSMFLSLLFNTAVLEGAHGVLMWLKVLYPKEEEVYGQEGAYTWYVTLCSVKLLCRVKESRREKTEQGQEIWGKAVKLSKPALQ